MKRTIALLMALVMSLALFAGCGNTDSGDGETKGTIIVAAPTNSEKQLVSYLYGYALEDAGYEIDWQMGIDMAFGALLSGDEQQRVGLARAMASDPSVMLMDEPFGAIDAITRAGLQDQLKNLQRNLHKTIMFVTHDIQEAFKLGNKVIKMDKGQVQQYDTPYNILFNPANDYVRRLTQSNSMYDKLCLVSVESVMDRAVPRTDAVIGLGANLGEALTYMVKNQTNDCKVMGSDGVAVGGLSLDKIWDVVRPAL